MTDEHPFHTGHLTVIESTVDGVRIVALKGELDQGTHDCVGEALNPPPDATSPRTVADLSDLTFMDSSGINLLIAAHRAAVGAQGWLRVSGTRPPVLRVMQLVGIDTLIPCLPTVREAIEG